MTLSRRFAIPGINRQVILYLLHSAIYHIGLFGITDVLLNFYFVSLGHTTETIGVLQSLTRVGSVLTGIPVGLLANRIGTKRLAVWGMVGVAMSYLLMVTVPTVPILLISRLLLGVCYGAAYIAAAPIMIGLVRREEQTHLFSHFNVVTMAATSFGSFVGGYLPTLAAAVLQPDVPNPAQSTAAYGAGLAIAGLLILISLLPLLRLREGSRDMPLSAVPAGSSRPATERIPWGRLSFLSLPFLFFGITAGLTFPYYNLFFRSTFKIDDQTVGTTLSIGWLGMALITVGNPWLERRFGRANALGVTLSIAAGAFVVLGTASTLWVGVVAFVVAVSMRNTMTPLFQPLLLETLPRAHHNVVSSLCSVIWSMGWFVSTAAGGFLVRQFGYGVMMIIVAIGVFITGLSIVLIFRHRKPFAEPPAQPTLPDVAEIEAHDP